MTNLEMSKSRSELYSTLLNPQFKSGTASSLKTKIGENNFAMLLTLGYIQLGANEKYEPEYKVTTYGNMQCTDYLSLLKLKEELSDYCQNIGV